MFSSLSFNQPARRFWKNRAEPDFGPGNAASLINCGRKPAVVPEVSTPSRGTTAAGRSVGTLLYLASVGPLRSSEFSLAPAFGCSHRQRAKRLLIPAEALCSPTA